MERLAIIGTGIAGMSCGHFLHRHYDLEFYEQNNYVGGHTNTVYVAEEGRQIPIDTGFIVFNDETYPNLVKLFRHLNVETKPTDMSFGVQYLPDGLEYSSKNLFAQKQNYLNPGFIRMLFQINRFFSEADELLTNDKYSAYTINDFIREGNYGEDFIYKYIVPMSSALWSTPTDLTLQFPARVLARFFKNHGLLGIDTQFQWHTVHRGSWQYRDKLIAPFRTKINVGTAAISVSRQNDKVNIIGSDGSAKEFDRVILACHADQALRLLQDPSDLEIKLLSPFHYQKNVATLHQDDKIMPRIRSTWSAWNYRVEKIDGKLVPTTIYDMNILQQVSNKRNYFLSINDPGRIDPAKVIKTIDYEHPIFTPQTAMVQKDLADLNEGSQTYFCGSYFRFGFHEDALTSSVELCSRLLKKNVWEMQSRNPQPALSS